MAVIKDINLWIMFVIFAGAIIFALLVFYNLKSSSSWPSVKGTIVRIEMKELLNRSNESVNRGHGGHDFEVDIEYTYSVDNVSYTGTKIAPIMPNIYGQQSIAEQVLQTYPQGSETEVYYNPKNPDKACLITGKQIPLIGFVVLFVLITGIGTLIFFGLRYLAKSN